MSRKNEHQNNLPTGSYGADGALNKKVIGSLGIILELIYNHMFHRPLK